MKWEYKTIKLGTTGLMGGVFDERKLDEYMNNLGDSGWELVVGLDTAMGYGQTRDVVVIFKRQIEGYQSQSNVSVSSRNE